MGALTLTRFFAIHALLLPAILVALVQVHMALVWRKGPTAPGSRVGERPARADRSLSQQLVQNAAALLLTVLVVIGLALFRPVELEFKANPADSTYHPRPEWYFLFLFRFLNDFGKLPVIGNLPEWVPAGLLPGLALAFLALAPWIDRGPERHPARRPLMIGVLAVGLIGIIGFTWRAYATLEPNATPRNSLYGHFTAGGGRELDPTQIRSGRAAFAACGGCHGAYGDYSGRTGPDLTGYGFKTFLAEVEGHPEARKLSFYERFARYVRGEMRPPETRMPKYPVEMLSPADLDALGAYLSQDPTRAAP